MKSERCKRVSLFAVLLCVVLASSAGAVQFYVMQISDTHYTSGTMANGSRAAVQAANNLPGTAWPYGTLGTPEFAIHCGDITDGGTSDSIYTTRWNGFNYNFPQNGIQGDDFRLEYPIYAVGGNHDRWRRSGYTGGTSTLVAGKIKTRYGGNYSSGGNNYYSFNAHGVHFCSIGRCTDSTVRSWLATDLASVGTSTPVILFLHYDFLGSNEWWSSTERTNLANTIAGYNIIAILHGHTHNTANHYVWSCPPYSYDVHDDSSATYWGFFNMFVIDTEAQTIGASAYCAHCAGGERSATDGQGYWDYGAWGYTFSRGWGPFSSPSAPPDPGAGTHIQYVGHCSGIGWQSWVMDGADAGTTGQSRSMQAYCVRSLNTTVTYRAYVAYQGWQDWKTDGAVAGTTGRDRAMEGVQITVGAGYSVSYQAHVSGIGWMDVVSNGATAGSTGSSIEALRVWLTQN